MEDRLMTLKQLAEYLTLNERTVLKLVQEGTIPGVKIGNQWRFRRPMIETWLDDQMLGVTPRSVVGDDPSGLRRVVTMESCFDESHIVANLQGITKAEIVVELASHAHRAGLVSNDTWFVGALFQRESVMPGAVGDGYAVLHTLKRHPERVTSPFLVVGRSREGVDFDSLDGKPTHVFFVLGLRYNELELPWLSEILKQFSSAGILESLLAASDAGAIYEILETVAASKTASERIP
jgi:excisionase family DNA binding protein